MSQRNLKGLARAEALQNFSSSEQLDQRLVVVRGASWLFVVMIGAALGLALAWAFLGRVPSFVDGQGIVTEAGSGPIIVHSPYAYGDVATVLVEEQLVVRAGDPLVAIRNPEHEQAIEVARETLALRRAEDAAMRVAEDELLAKGEASRDRQVSAARESQRLTRELIEALERELVDVTELVERQLMPRSQLLQAQSLLSSSRQQIEQQEAMIAQAEAALEQTRSTIEQGRLRRAETIATADGSVQVAETRLAVSTTIAAPVDGEILSILVTEGSSVRTGDPILTLGPLPPKGLAPPIVTCFVPFGLGKEIRAGMPARISIPFAPPSRYGYLEGVVSWVGEFVADQTGSGRGGSVGDASLTRSIGGQIGPMIEVSVTVLEDPRTPSGLAWTSREGYPQPLEMPLLCGVQVVIREDRPISLLLPWIKDLLGIDQPPTLVGTAAAP